MKRRTKTLLWMTAVLGAFLLFALVFPVFAPRIIDLAPVRDRIQTRLSEAIGGTVTFDRIDVAILPRPRMKARRPSIAVAGAFVGGNLIAVPVRVQGPLQELKVDIMKPSAVGDQLVGLTTRVLKLRFKIVEPVLPAKPKRP
jgi:hypothetical protein